jgi:Flp pilus assembly protein TadG
MGRDSRDDRGAALIEMAILTPILLLLVVGIWTTARAWNVHNTIDHAVREAARYGATVDPWTTGSSTDNCGGASSEATIRCAADEQLSASAINPALVDTTCIELSTNPCSVGNATGNDKVAVSLTYPNYQLDFVFFSVSIDLSASAVSRHES